MHTHGTFGEMLREDEVIYSAQRYGALWPAAALYARKDVTRDLKRTSM